MNKYENFYDEGYEPASVIAMDAESLRLWLNQQCEFADGFFAGYWGAPEHEGDDDGVPFLTDGQDWHVGYRAGKNSVEALGDEAASIIGEGTGIRYILLDRGVYHAILGNRVDMPHTLDGFPVVSHFEVEDDD